MDEAPEVPEAGKKKKRKYTKRGSHRVAVDGKTFYGSEICREGKFLVLKTQKGSVMVNTETARTPIEITGEITVQTLAGVAAAMGGPVASGHAADFAARRNKQLGELLTMPAGLEES